MLISDFVAVSSTLPDRATLLKCNKPKSLLINNWSSIRFMVPAGLKFIVCPGSENGIESI